MQTCNRCYRIVNRACQSDTEALDCPNLRRKRPSDALPVFVLASTLRISGVAAPDGADVAEWEDVCHGQRSKKFLLVDYQSSISPSRWTYRERKRKFIVLDQGWFQLGASATLEGALKIAQRIQRELTGGA
jgi:hypothetical protein